MYPVLKSSYDYFENLKGPKLVSAVVLLVIVSLTAGLIFGYLPSITKSNNDTETEVVVEGDEKVASQERYGRIVYVDPSKYPDERISYKLVDIDNGKDMILLRTSDDKLRFLEGGVAKLRGRIESTASGEEVLFVEKIVFN